MANEITLTASLSIYKPSIMSAAVGRSVTNMVKNMTGTTYIQDSFSVPTSTTVIPLGGVTNPHWAFFFNTDPTNYIQLYNGSSGAVFLRLLAGEYAFCPLDPGLTLYGISNTAACVMEYLIAAA